MCHEEIKQGIKQSRENLASESPTSPDLQSENIITSETNYLKSLNQRRKRRWIILSTIKGHTNFNLTWWLNINWIRTEKSKKSINWSLICSTVKKHTAKKKKKKWYWITLFTQLCETETRKWQWSWGISFCLWWASLVVTPQCRFLLLWGATNMHRYVLSLPTPW